MHSLRSVKTSDQDWARYIRFVLMQFSTVEPKAVQSIHNGQHWKRLAKKKAIVQTRTTATMLQTAGLTKVPLKILGIPLSRSGHAE